MTREQYEDQKRRLAEQHRSLVEIVDSAYQSQLKALDMVWRMLSGEGAGEVRPAPVAAAPPQAAAPAPPARRRKAGELEAEVSAIFPRLPEVFAFTDVCRLLGYAPDRGSLYRVLQEWRIAGLISTVSFGSGTKPARYRKEKGDDGKADA
jgi:hypothetical protein